MKKLEKSSDAFSQLELGRIISKLYRQGRGYFDQRMSTFGLGSGQHVFLFFLYNHNGASQDEISRSLELDKGTTARAIQKLEERGFVTRVTDEKDKRINRIHLTDKAYEIQDELNSFSQEWKAILVSDMSDEELYSLKNLMEKLSYNGSNYRNGQIKKGGQHDE